MGLDVGVGEAKDPDLPNPRDITLAISYYYNPHSSISK
jgi:hypothetical protein